MMIRQKKKRKRGKRSSSGSRRSLGQVHILPCSSPQAIARYACDLGVGLTVFAPKRIPNQKRRSLEAYGADVRLLEIDAFFKVLVEQKGEGLDGVHFVRPGGSPELLAGIASIALEILEDLPDVDVIAVPFGSGALACSVGLVLQELRPQTKVVACEVRVKCLRETPSKLNVTMLFFSMVLASG